MRWLRCRVDGWLRRRVRKQLCWPNAACSGSHEPRDRPSSPPLLYPWTYKLYVGPWLYPHRAFTGLPVAMPKEACQSPSQ